MYFQSFDRILLNSSARSVLMLGLYSGSEWWKVSRKSYVHMYGWTIFKLRKNPDFSWLIWNSGLRIRVTNKYILHTSSYVIFLPNPSSNLVHYCPNFTCKLYVYIYVYKNSRPHSCFRNTLMEQEVHLRQGRVKTVKNGCTAFWLYHVKYSHIR